jgi:hypothetical protein
MTTYSVLLTKEKNHYTGRVLALPDIVISGAEEAEVIEQIRNAISDVQANGRIVRVDVPTHATNDPWLRYAGMWKDDPNWDLFQSEIEAFRREIDRETNPE